SSAPRTHPPSLHDALPISIPLVDVLNDGLPPISAREIEIDVRPFASCLAQETLEQQFHADGVHRGDPERVADRAVGRRAATLDRSEEHTSELQSPDHLVCR